MSDASVFRLYAEEALLASTKATSETEKRALEDLACTWATAAMASERVCGDGPISWPRGVAEAKPQTHF